MLYLIVECLRGNFEITDDSGVLFFFMFCSKDKAATRKG